MFCLYRSEYEYEFGEWSSCDVPDGTYCQNGLIEFDKTRSVVCVDEDNNPAPNMCIGEVPPSTDKCTIICGTLLMLRVCVWFFLVINLNKCGRSKTIFFSFV